jgi:hypothetical protein
MISLHKDDEFQLIIDQYEAIKAKQMADLVLFFSATVLLYISMVPTM